MKLTHRWARCTRRFFFFIHLWTAAILGLWFVMIGLTGSSLAWPELIGAEMKAMFPYEKATPGAPQIPLSKALAAIREAQPDITPRELGRVIVPNRKFPFYIFIRQSKPSGMMLYLVDPYSGKVNPPRRVIDFTTGKLEFLHMNLILEAKGLIANGIASFFALFMLLSGLWLWWPSNFRQLKLRLTIKRNASLSRRLKDLHNLMGIYLYAILFVTTLTAVIMAYNGSTGSSVEKALDGTVTEPKPITIKPVGTPLSDDILLERARVALPDAQFNFLMRPVKPDAPFQAQFVGSEYGFLREGILKLNPYSGEVLGIERDSEATRGHKTMGLIEDLHVGSYGGVWTKILYTIAGFMPLGLYISALLMWWKRKQSRKVSSPKSASTPA